MKKIKELNPDLKWFVLQSTNENKFEDHIELKRQTLKRIVMVMD